MLPNRHNIAGQLTPTVFHLAARSMQKALHLTLIAQTSTRQARISFQP